MIESCDSNILFAMLHADAPGHAQARAYLDAQQPILAVVPVFPGNGLETPMATSFAMAAE